MHLCVATVTYHRIQQYGRLRIFRLRLIIEWSTLRNSIQDKEIIWLLEDTITSFETKRGKGLPLGNLTSQLLVNVYMNEFDQFMKHELKTKYYI